MQETSIIVPTKGRLDFLRRSLESIVAQSYQDYEVLVILDGSDPEVSEWVTTAYPSFRCLVNHDTPGAASTRNIGLAEAKGDFIAFLDDDDYWDTDYLQTQIEYLQASPASIMVYSGHYIGSPDTGWSIADDRPILEESDTVTLLLSECFIHTMSVMVCRSKALGAGLLDPSLSIVHDYDWYLRIIAHTDAPIGYAPQPLVYRTLHSAQLTSGLYKWMEEEIAVIDKYFEHHPEAKNHEPKVRAYRALYFGYLAIKSEEYIVGLRLILYAFFRHSFRSASGIAVERIRRNTSKWITDKKLKLTKK